MVKNPPTVGETWLLSLGWEDPLEEGMATHSSILAWRIPMDRKSWWATVHGVTRVRHDKWLSIHTSIFIQSSKQEEFLSPWPQMFVFVEHKELTDHPHYLKAGKTLIWWWIQNISIICSNNKFRRIQESSPFLFNRLYVFQISKWIFGVDIDKRMQISM